MQFLKTKFFLGLLCIVALGSMGFQNFILLQEPVIDEELLTQAVQAADMGLTEGSFEFFDIYDCFAPESNICFGNNPITPYGVVRAPLPEEDGTQPENSGIFLREDEAILIIGTTPPDSRYFGFTPYLYTRAGDPKRQMYYASLTDTINLIKIKTTGSSLPGENVFKQTTALVLTADHNMYNDMVSLLAQLNIPQTAVNHLEIPVTFPLYMGYDATTADDFSVLLRVTLSENTSELDLYLQSNPFLVYRITPNTPRAIDPVPTRPYLAEGSGVTEEQTVPGITSALDNLVTDIKRKYRVFRQNKVMITKTWYTEKIGHDCILGLEFCSGDNHDALYGIDAAGAFKLSYDPNDFIIIAGVNHKLLGKALYSNHSVYKAANLGGIISAADDVYDGSAQYHAGRNQLHYNKLYAIKIARYCSSEEMFCVEIPEPTPDNPIGANVDDILMLLNRMYVDPATTVRPSIDEIIPSQALAFKPRMSLVFKPGM